MWKKTLIEMCYRKKNCMSGIHFWAIYGEFVLYEKKLHCWNNKFVKKSVLTTQFFIL